MLHKPGGIFLAFVLILSIWCVWGDQADKAFEDYMTVTGLSSAQIVTVNNVWENATEYAAFLATLNSTMAAAVNAKIQEFNATMPKLFGLAGNIYQQYANALTGRKAKKLEKVYEKMINFKVNFQTMYRMAKKLIAPAQWHAANAAAENVVTVFNTANPDFIGFVESIVGTTYGNLSAGK